MQLALDFLNTTGLSSVMSEYAVIVTHSTSHAIRAEKILLSAGLEAKMIPVPRHISSDCGTAVRIPVGQVGESKRLMDEKKAPYDRVELL
jgi:hypothetical protein